MFGKQHPELKPSGPVPEPKHYTDARQERNALSIKAGEQDRKTAENMQKQNGKH